MAFFTVGMQDPPPAPTVVAYMPDSHSETAITRSIKPFRSANEHENSATKTRDCEMEIDDTGTDKFPLIGAHPTSAGLQCAQKSRGASAFYCNPHAPSATQSSFASGCLSFGCGGKPYQGIDHKELAVRRFQVDMTVNKIE